MSQISLKNIHRPTSAFWTKVTLGCTFVAQSILGTALASDNHILAWVAFGLQIVAGLVPIMTNGVATILVDSGDKSNG